MPDDPMMIERLRTALAGLPVTEQKMFGGTCFMLAGNMLVGTSKRGLLVRVGKEGHRAAVARPHVRAMTMGEREMAGYVFVAEEGLKTAADLKRWLDVARAHVETLPSKTARVTTLRSRKTGSTQARKNGS